MKEDSELLKVALRVLAAVIEHCEPEGVDVQMLASHVPRIRGPADELACEVIHQVLRARGRISDGMEERVSRTMAGGSVWG